MPRLSPLGHESPLSTFVLVGRATVAVQSKRIQHALFLSHELLFQSKSFVSGRNISQTIDTTSLPMMAAICSFEAEIRQL